MDKVALLIGAGIDGRASFPSVFERKEKHGDEPTLLTLIEVKTYESGTVLIRYKTKSC